MKVVFYLVLIAFLFLISFSHKSIKGRRDIETPTGPGAKTYLTMRPESIGLDLIKNHKTKNNYNESAGSKSSEAAADNKSGQ